MVEICWLQGITPTTAAMAFAASYGDTAAAEAVALGAMWHIDNRLVNVARKMSTGVEACMTEAASMNEVQNILECFTRSGLRSAAFMSVSACNAVGAVCAFLSQDTANTVHVIPGTTHT